VLPNRPDASEGSVDVNACPAPEPEPIPGMNGKPSPSDTSPGAAPVSDPSSSLVKGESPENPSVLPSRPDASDGSVEVNACPAPEPEPIPGMNGKPSPSALSSGEVARSSVVGRAPPPASGSV